MGGRVSPRRRVLVVEDNVDAAESLAEILKLHGFSCAVAFSGSEGLEVARRFQPQVIVCDVGMPAMDGLSFARQLRLDQSLRAVRLVALSGHVQPEHVQCALDAGFDCHIGKPADIERLVELVS